MNALRPITDANEQPAMVHDAAITPPSATNLCYFTDKLSAELRIHIYKLVFGPGERAQRAPAARRLQEEATPSEESEDDTDDIQIVTEDITHLTDLVPPIELQPIHTNIFAVNRLIHDESIEAFYNNKIISATFGDFDRLLRLEYPCRLFRDIEIVACNFGWRAEYLRGLLRATRGLPRLRSFTILSDSLTCTGPLEDQTTVRQFVEQHDLGDGLLCTDVGRYKLGGEFSKIAIVNKKLLQMWSGVRDTPDKFDAIQEVRKLVDAAEVSTSEINLMGWATHTSLRLWVGMVQRYFDRLEPGIMQAPDVEVPPREESQLTAFWHSCSTNLSVPRDKPLYQLDSTDNPKLLEQITEMLSINLQSYYMITPHGEHFRQPRWVELGCECELLRQSMHEAKVKKAASDHWMLVDPINGMRHEGDKMRDALENSVFANVYRLAEIQATFRELLHFFFSMLLATGRVEGPIPYTLEESRTFEAWSSNLIRDYFRWARVEDMSLLDEADILVLRSSFRNAIASIAVSINPPVFSQMDGDDGDESLVDGKEINEGEQEDLKVFIQEVSDLAKETDQVDYDHENTRFQENHNLCKAFVRKFGRYFRYSWTITSRLMTVPRGREALLGLVEEVE